MSADPLTAADVVIVGGGSCGSVLAARLSENPDRRVLLLEAGPSRIDAAQNIVVLPVAPGSPSVWSQPAQLSAGRRAMLVPGRGLGGSGAVNGGYFIRAVPRDLDKWPGPFWTYDRVLPFFRDSEADLDYPDQPWHGAAGPVPVHRDDATALTTMSRAFAQSCLQLGFTEEADKNAVGAPGIGPVPLNARSNRRVGPGVAYLLPALSRVNLQVRGSTMVHRIVVAGGRVIGVQVNGGAGLELVAAPQVLLCAGGIGTPRLLLHSGIGPAEQLRGLGIDVVQHLPGVGRAFSNHPEVLLPYRTRREFTAGAAVLQTVLNTADGLEVRPYTASFTELVPGTPRLPRQLGVALMQPTSRGTIALRTADPGVAPMIDHRYLASAVDRSALRHGVSLALELFAKPALRAVAEPLEVQASDEWVEAHLGTSQHLCGSAPMGPESDADAVADDRLRVRGIEGLRIVDTSVMPVVPSRGPHATAVMLAERAAALIGGDDKQ